MSPTTVMALPTSAVAPPLAGARRCSTHATSANHLNKTAHHAWRASVWSSRPRPISVAVCAKKKKVKADAPGDDVDPRTLHPNVIGIEDLDELKNLTISADKFADDLARRVNSGEIGGEDRLRRDYGLLSEEVEALSTRVSEGLGGTSIYLVGMMGSGKSTVGKLLASVLKYCYFDSDALIEQASNKTIAEMFAEDGEQDFRDAETKVLQVWDTKGGMAAMHHISPPTAVLRSCSRTRSWWLPRVVAWCYARKTGVPCSTAWLCD